MIKIEFGRKDEHQHMIFTEQPYRQYGSITYNIYT